MWNRAPRLITPWPLSPSLSFPAGAAGPAAGAAPDLIPVKGKVTYKGQPVTKGVVRFEPDGYGRPASGKLQSDGTFVLTTLKEGDGVVAGDHRVSITDSTRVSPRIVRSRKYASAEYLGPDAEVSQEKTEFTFDLK